MKWSRRFTFAKASAELRRSAFDDREIYAFAVFERAFKDFGLPETIRTDNGARLHIDASGILHRRGAQFSGILGKMH